MPEDIHWRKYANRYKTFPKRIDKAIKADLSAIICIPVFREPDVLATMNSLFNCEHQGINVEVILVYNKNSMISDQDNALHDHSWKECLIWINQHQKAEITFLPVYIDEFSDTGGGVGWARKIAMDEAARRLDADGIIVCLDADCTVSTNYIQAIVQHFQEFRKCDAASIFIEHALNHLNPLHRDAIIQYELHLRYLIQAQKWCGHPFASQTIGSAMAVRRRAYFEQGGMNTRRAGEDFYFLQKFIELGSHMDIRNTIVYPSARISSRVPFGTGKAMQQILEDRENWMTTNFEIFASIKSLFLSLDKLRIISMIMPLDTGYEKLHNELGLSSYVLEYLQQIEFLEECHTVAMQTASYAAFRKRFFRFFNAFRMIKYIHYMRDHHFPDVPVIESVARLTEEMKWAISSGESNAYAYLKLFRNMDRKNR